MLIMKISRHSTDEGDYGFHARCHSCLCLACPSLLTFCMIPAHKRRHMHFEKGPISQNFMFYETTNTTVLETLEMKYNFSNVIHYHYNRISIKIIKEKQEKTGPESYSQLGSHCGFGLLITMSDFSLLPGSNLIVNYVYAEHNFLALAFSDPLPFFLFLHSNLTRKKYWSVCTNGEMTTCSQT